MFTFYPFAYCIASDMMQKKVKNSSTGNPYNIGDIITVSTASITAMMTLGGIIPIMPAIIRARVCAKKVFDVIERKPQVDTNPGSKDNVSLVKGIEFKSISFRYPTQVEHTKDIFSGASF